MSDNYKGDLDFSGEGGDHLAILINLDSVAGLLPSYSSTDKIYADETRDRFMQYTVDMFFRPYSYVEAIHRNLMLGLFPTHAINNPFKDMSAFAQNTLDQINMEFSMLLRALLTPVVMNKGRIYAELVCSDVSYELLLFAPVGLFDDSLTKSMKIVKWSRIEDLVLGFRHLRKARHPIRENKVSHLNGMEDVHKYVGPLGLSSVLLEETLAKVDSKKKSKKKVTA